MPAESVADRPRDRGSLNDALHYLFTFHPDLQQMRFQGELMGEIDAQLNPMKMMLPVKNPMNYGTVICFLNFKSWVHPFDE
jgi:hypothetical protein